MKVRVQVRYKGGDRSWKWLASGTMNQTGKSDPEASTFDERIADETVERLAEDMPDWWVTVAEYRVTPVSRSGPTQPEDERERRGVLIRLSPDELAVLDAVAARWGLTRSAAVVRLAREAST